MKNLVDSRPKLTSPSLLGPSLALSSDDGANRRKREEKRKNEMRGKKKEKKDGRFPVSRELDFTIFLRSRRRNGNVALRAVGPRPPTSFSATIDSLSR